MPLVLFHTEKVRQALKAPRAIGIELIVLVGIVGIFAALLMMAHQWGAPLRESVVISLSFWALPKYTLMSLCRGLAAYVLSLIFTLIYGTVAAHNERAERIMIPALDVLQAIPVLGFLPGLVIALVHLFPTRNLGLELACVIMIFTGQVWNMTFSFHGSLRGIPTALREVAAVQRLTGWQIFRILEVPAAMIGLVWNSMMSMAGGWFFLTVNEAFTLRDHDYRLPGIGSYMNEAINRGNTPAMIAGIIAMIVMIVSVDQLLWRPIIVWSQRFKLEDQGGADAPKSWVLNLFQKSRLLGWIERLFRAQHHRINLAKQSGAKKIGGEKTSAMIFAIARWLVLALLLAGVLWGIYALAGLMIDATRQGDWKQVVLALLASFARTSAAVLIGMAWALPAGIVIGLSPKWSQRLQPIVQVLASFPAPMLFPLVTLAIVALHINFGIGCVVLMLLGAQWYILFNVMAGASAVPAELVEAANVYHMSRAQKWKRLYLPSVFPYLVTGLVTAAGGAWNATIVSEYLQIGPRTFSAFGLGAIIAHATADGNFPLLAASVLTMAFFVVLVNRLFWKKLYRLAESKYSLNV